jgi:hypothetical protein
VNDRITQTKSVLEENSPVQRIVAIDWSGRVDAAGQRRHIWAGVWTCLPGKASKLTLDAGRTREELTAWLIDLAREIPRMAVGIDCCFSYPAWFLKEHRCKTVFDFWRAVADGNGEEWLHRDCPDDRFWGKAGTKRNGRRPDEFCGPGLHRSFRLTDIDNKITPKLLLEDPERAAKVMGITPKSPFQIGGSGTVGTGTLRAMPFLLQLREAGFRAWPFESAALTAETPQPLLLEIYTRLLTGAVAKSNPAARKAYLAALRTSDPAYAAISRSVLAKAESSEDAFDALVCTIEMVRHRTELPRLRATDDPTLRLEGITWRPGVQNSPH